MKNLSDATALCFDGGLFFELALRLARNGFKRVLYQCSIDLPFPKLNEAVIGDGFYTVERVLDFWPIKDEIDCFVFPDSSHPGLQLELVSQGKAVWGSRNGCLLEWNRQQFVETLKSLGLSAPEFTPCHGLRALRKHLEPKTDQYVKISRWRGCFDEQTEILTDSGWKYFNDLQSIHKVATMDVETRKLEFLSPAGYIKYWHEGQMLSIQGKRINALVTPNHCFWAKTGLSMKAWKYRPLFELARRHDFLIPQSCKWEGREMVSVSVPDGYVGGIHAQRTWAGERIHAADSFLTFLGWFLSEGSLSLTGPHLTKYRVTISQSKIVHPDKYIALEDCLNKLGYNYQREGEMGFSIYNKSLYLYLAQHCYVERPCSCRKRHCCHRKQVPRFTFDLCPRQINMFLTSYSYGDGGRDRTHNTFYTSSPHLADDVQRLLILSGQCGTISSRIRKPVQYKGRLIQTPFRQFSVSVQQRTNIQISQSHIKPKHYSGYVYDVTVPPHHSILVRRHGTVFWSGNSMETFHWVDYQTSSGRLDELSVEFGGMQEDVTFLVFPNIEAVAELGYDGFNVRGQFPRLSVSGVEAKDKGYLGSIIAWDDLPEELRTINEAFSPILSKLGYANFWSAEGRKTEDDFFFTDPCPRHASPAGEGQLELYGNLPEIIWAGANGECIDPEPVAKHVAQAIIDHQGNEQHWRRIVIPDVVRPWVKLYNPVKIAEEVYDLPPLPHSCDSIGSVLGIGDTPTEAVEALKENASALDGQPLTIHIESLVDAAIELEAAEKEGMTLTDEPMPAPERIVT